MLKTLIALSSITSLGGMAVNPYLVSSSIMQSQNQEQMQINYHETLDHVKYEIKSGEVFKTKLEEMLDGIKYLNNLHRESGKKIRLFGLPAWWALDDQEKMVANNYIEGSALLNLSSLINSDAVEFNYVVFQLHAATKATIKITLGYQIADINQEIPLFDFRSESSFPLQQNDLKVYSLFNFWNVDESQ